MSAYYANCGRCGTSFLTTTPARWMCAICYNAERQEDMARSVNRMTSYSNVNLSPTENTLLSIFGIVVLWWLPAGLFSMLLYAINAFIGSQTMDYLIGCLAYASWMYPIHATFIVFGALAGLFTGEWSLLQNGVHNYITGILE